MKQYPSTDEMESGQKTLFFKFCMQKHGTPIVPAAEDVIGTHLHVTVLNKEKWQQFFPFVVEEKCPLGL